MKHIHLNVVLSIMKKIGKHDVYCGQRIKRGLFESKDGHRLNADVNGSFNIIRLGI